MKFSIRPLQFTELNQAAEILSQSFSEDAPMLWIFGSRERYQQKSKAVFKTWLRYCLLYGRVYCSDDLAAVVMLKDPSYNEVSLWRALRSGVLSGLWVMGKDAWDRMLQYDAFSAEQAHKNLEGKPYHYLWMIGTSPEYRRQGYAQALLKHVHEKLQVSTVKNCYLDASSESSASLYKANQYQTLNQFKIPSTEIIISAMEKTCLG